MSKIVYLSPSTQERNIGYGNYGTEEKRMNEVADVVQKILAEHGITVYRNKPEWNLGQVVKDSNLKKPHLHFAIHSNAGGGRGAEIYAYSPGGEGEKAARLIYKEIEPLTPTGDRGVKFNPRFYELNSTNSPAVLVEIAFHDNKDDAEWIMQNIEVVGTALAKGLLKLFNVSYEESSVPQEQLTGCQTLYRVMAGSYGVRENAENQIQRLKKAGFDATIMIFNKE